MNWKLSSLQNGFDLYSNDWDKLNLDLYQSNPYFDSRFVKYLLKYFGSGNEIICTHCSKDNIDGMLIVHPSGIARWSLFMSSQSQICPLLISNVIELPGLISELPGIAIALDCPCQDPIHSPITVSSPVIPQVKKEHVRTIAVNIDSSFDKYWSARSGNLRKSIARRIRRLQDANYQIRLKHLDDKDVMQAAILRFGEIESKGWKGKIGTAIHGNNIQGAFYADVMSGFADSQQASVYELYFNDILVAMQLCILSKNMLVLLKTTYDEIYSNFSPGRLLLYLLLQREFSLKRVRLIEFYTNADNDQLTWATQQRIINHFTIFRNTLAKNAYILLHSIK